MNKFLFILLVCFAAISCNSYDDEVGYITTTGGTCFQDIISANHTSCKIKYGHTIKEVEGNPKISKVVFKLSGEGEEELVDAQKGEDNIYYAEFEIPYDKYVKISTIATINGEDRSISERGIYYDRSQFCPYSTDYICTNPLNYDVIRYVVECNNTYFFKSKISEATVTIGQKTYPLTITDDKKIYCDINLYDIANCSCYPVLTIKNEVDEYRINGGAYMEVKKVAITGYDTSNDGKEIDGCIYLAGTKWAKGVIVKGSDGKNHLDINEEDGVKTEADFWNYDLEDNDLDGYKIPSLGQADSLIHYCSIQKVNAENASNCQYVVYPAKKNEKIISFFYNIKSTPIADIRRNGVYIKSNERYTSIKYKNAYGGYDAYYYYYYPERDNMFAKYFASRQSCLLLPIKD